MKLLEVRDLDVAYGHVRVLHRVSLHVNAREVAALVGPNGAGKTTLLSCISGLMPPQRGEVLLDGRPIAGQPAHAVVRAGISHVPQGRRLFADLSVHENLLLGAYLQRDRRAVQEALAEVLSIFPILAQRAHQRAGTLSGGEQQMLAIARALMSRPRIILLDEPTLGLAPMVVEKVAEVIEEIRRRGVAVLLVEQDARLAFDVADYVWVMEIGRIAVHGTPAQLAASPHVQEAYLGA